ncbi:MAG: hypothetical protein HUU56_01855 [Bdellovibrionaceae bacterium]|nr:hypothetical protein [Pseudobdellovibrionaceae bacterium]
MKKIFLIGGLLMSQFLFAEGFMDGNWTTGYVSGSGKIDLQVEDSKVLLKIDRNTCSLNAIGEPTACTRMAALEIQGKLEADVESSGRFPRGTMIYKIKDTSYGVVYFRNAFSTWHRLLKYDKKGVVIFAANLEMKTI